MRFDPKKLKGKRAAVIGLGLSGRAAASLLLRKGFKVFGTDSRPRKEVRTALGRLAGRIQWEGGGHSDKALACAFAVKSPGLPPGLPVLSKLRQKGVPVFSELEVALAFSKAKRLVAVTGTNGKTTTTALTGAVLARQWGRSKVHVCGNIGLPVSEAAAKAKAGHAIVLEVSSYQLEDSAYFRPDAAAVLNITPDHLDHHGSMANYIRAKGRVFRDQGAQDACVFNGDDPLTQKLARECRSQRLFFGGPAALANAWLEKGKIILRLPGSRPVAVTPPKLPGKHNLENAMAAALLARAVGAGAPAIAKAFREFKGVEHRLEEVGTVKGLRCVNDSKATNVDSTLVALRAFEEAERNILLVLGGLHKGSPYGPLRGLVERKAKAVLTIGSAAAQIERDLAGAAHVFPCGDLATAVDTAFKVGQKGDILLLSPACASFDQFKNFEDRGRRFKTLVGEFR